MHIEKLEIKGFGKLKNRTIRLAGGINILYGSNEAGKSTLQWFIRGMLFGLKSGRPNISGLPSPQKRYRPWEAGEYGGAMTYVLDDGSLFRIERDFEEGTVRLFDGSYSDISGRFEAGKDRLPLFAERQLGMDHTTFERTALIAQMEVRLDESSSAALSGRFANARDTGLEDVSLERAEKALKDAIRNNVGTLRSRTQPMDKLEARLKELEAQHVRLLQKLEGRQAAEEELRKARGLRSRMESEERYLECVEGLIETRRLLDEYLKKEAGLKDAVRQLKSLTDAMRKTEESDSGRQQPFSGTRRSRGPEQGSIHSRSRRTIPLLCFATAVILAALVIYFLLNGGTSRFGILSAIGTAVSMAAFMAGLLLWNRVSSVPRKSITSFSGKEMPKESGDKVEREQGMTAPEQNTALSSVLNAAALICGRPLENTGSAVQELCGISTHLEELSKKLEAGIETARSLGSDSEGFFRPEDLDMVIYDTDIKNLESAWKKEKELLAKTILEAALKEKYCEGLLEEGTEKEELQRVEEETVAVREKITYLKHKGDALKLAYDVLTEAGSEIRRTFAPELDKRMGGIVSGLTQGRYTDIRGSDRLSLNVALPDSGDVKNVLTLSGGTADQMYLAMRLSMAELLTEGKESVPLIMDEVFSQFDDNRTLLALKYLHDTYDKKQILIFTCKQREVELAKEIFGSDMNLVEMGYELPVRT